MSRFGADIMNIFISDDENYLIFTNKNDGTLWSLKLKKINGFLFTPSPQLPL